MNPEDKKSPQDAPVVDDEGAHWDEFDKLDATATPDADHVPADAAADPPAEPPPSAPLATGAPAAPDLWTNAAPAQKAAYEAAIAERERLAQMERSHAGRLSVWERENKRLKDELEAARSAAPAQPAQGSLDEYFATDEWKVFAEEYPEVAAPQRAAMERLSQATTSQAKVLETFERERTAETEQRQQAAYQSNEKLLDDIHPDWREIAGSQALSDWLAQAPPMYRDAATRNAAAIVDPREAADLIERFKDHAAGQSAGTKPPNSNPAPLPAKRQRQLESATSVPTRGPSAAIGIPDDEKGAWDAFDRMGL